jgi:hypothetical protein
MVMPRQLVCRPDTVEPGGALLALSTASFDRRTATVRDEPRREHASAPT